MTKLRIQDVPEPRRIQLREKMDSAAIAEFAEGMARGDEFPPVVVFKTEGYWLADRRQRS